MEGDVPDTMARAQLLRYEDALPAGGDPWFLCYFLHRLLDFRLADMESVAETVGCPVDSMAWRMPCGNEAMSPFWYVRLPSEEVAKKVAQRSMLTRGLMEVWGEGETWEELRAAIDAYPEERKAPWLDEGKAFKIAVETYGHKMGQDRQVDAINKLNFLEFKGRVDLKQPDVVFWLVICESSNNSGIPETVRNRMYFGREVQISDRSRVDTYALRKRAYIGPTSMDCEVAFIMVNLAKVQAGQLVLDPYAGTGSILVAAAAMGAYVMGTDIDIRVIRNGKVDAQGQQVDVYSNFQQYGSAGRLTGLLRMDMHTHALRPGLEETFHSVIGDPPYGVRAGGRKSVAKDVEIRDRESYIPSTDPYTLGECLRDLLDFSARMLVPGGRLVYFFPASPETYKESEVPGHPNLKLICNIEQLLTTRYSRRLIVMEKVGHYDAAAAAAYHAQKGEPVLAIDTLHEVVYEQRDAPSAKGRYRSKCV